MAKSQWPVVMDKLSSSASIRLDLYIRCFRSSATVVEIEATFPGQI